MTNHMRVVDDGDMRKYRTEIPNMIDDMDLTVYEFRLYVHLKRVAGAYGGTSYQGTRTLADCCSMSIGSVSKAKEGLISKGLIVVEGRGENESDLITIVDVWPQNFAQYATRCSPDEQGGVRVVNERSNPNNKKIAAAPTATSAVVQEELFHVEPEPVPQRDVDHPAVMEYRDLFRISPTKAQMRIIVEHNPDLGIWKRAMRKWAGRKYNPTNVDGMLEWAGNPSLMERRSKAQIKQDPTNGTTWQEMFDAQEENDGSYKGPAYVLPDGYME